MQMIDKVPDVQRMSVVEALIGVYQRAFQVLAPQYGCYLGDDRE